MLVYRELDDALGLADRAAGVLSDGRRGKNTRHLLAEVAVPRQPFGAVLSLIARLRAPPTLA